MRKEYLIGICIFVFLVAIDFSLFFNTRWFWSLLLLSFVLGVLPGFLKYLQEGKRQKDIETEFLEFIRSLSENVKSGIPIPQSILNLRDKDYGPLSPYILKLAYQIEWGIPIKDAFKVFSRDTNNKVIRRSISIINQAEKSGGKMEDILQSVVESVVNIQRLKDERRSSTYSQMVQGYIVFFIFIAIMLIMETQLMPLIQDMVKGLSSGSLSGAGFFEGPTTESVQLNFKTIFLSLIVVQGIFAGLLIGKFSEGSIKYGIKHSFALVVVALLVILTVSPP